jgi:hypothetical protein
MPILEAEVLIKSPDKAGAEAILLAELARHLDAVPAGRQVMLKLPGSLATWRAERAGAAASRRGTCRSADGNPLPRARRSDDLSLTPRRRKLDLYRGCKHPRQEGSIQRMEAGGAVPHRMPRNGGRGGAKNGGGAF